MRRKGIAAVLATTLSEISSRWPGGGADQIGDHTAKQYKAAGKNVAELPTDTKVAYLEALAKQGKPALPGARKEAVAAFANALGDKDAMKALALTGMDKELWKQYGADAKSAF